MEHEGEGTGAADELILEEGAPDPAEDVEGYGKHPFRRAIGERLEERREEDEPAVIKPIEDLRGFEIDKG